MKISKLFHWLYFIVMMLPILSIPIFAIYSHRHTIDSYSVSIDEPVYQSYDFSQYVINGAPSYYENHLPNNIDFDNVSDNEYGDGLLVYLYGEDSGIISYDFNGSIALDDVLLFKGNVSSNVSDLSLTISLDDLVYVAEDTNIGDFFLTFTCISDEFNDVLLFNFYNSYSYEVQVVLSNIQLFNLTAIFGSGNEPSLSECQNIFVDDYYDYGVTYQYDRLISTQTVVYNDTDIGSQFTYQVYNVVDKYFNYDNVFNFSQLYDYLNLTFFNGGASLGFFIFWHLLIYWLLTSLIWLIFDVLLYVPNLVHRWLDKASLS